RLTGAKRVAAIPDVPTIAETVPGYEVSIWYGIAAPRGTPPEIVEKLNQAVNAVLADPKLRARLAELGGEPMPMTPAEFGKLVAEETEKWAKVIRAANIKAESRVLPRIFHNVPLGERRRARRLAQRLDSERFRSTPRTCGCFRGILGLR